MTETSPVASVGWIKSTLRDRLATTSWPTSAPRSAPPVLGRRAAASSSRARSTRSRGTASRAASCSAGARGSPRPTTTTSAPARASPRDGWLRTGDVATIDEHGYIRLVDRTKDLIKSGGEWISSVELENELMAHPEDRGGGGHRRARTRSGRERPLACVVVEAGARRSRRTRCSTSWLPAWPSGSCPTTWCSSTRCPRRRSGKFSKKALRERFADFTPLPRLNSVN